MSYNDRLEEAAIWVANQPGETVALPKADVFAALWAARNDPGHWPWELADWARDPEHRALHFSQECWDASVPADEWEDYSRYLDEAPLDQPKHTGCTGMGYGGIPCDCPCHQAAPDPT